MTSTTMQRLIGRRILITGGASGLGAAIASRFAEQGACLALLDRNGVGAAEKARELGAYSVGVDVTDFSAVAGAAADAAAAIGGIDGIINAAGILLYKRFEETSDSEWRSVVDVNLTGNWNTCRACLPFLRAAESATIVNIASGLGLRPAPYYSAYAAAKGGIIALTRSLAMEFAPNIRVNAICPGAVETPMTAPLLHTDGERKRAAANYALGRLGAPTEVANAALYLTSAESAFTTGIALPVDGGRSFH